MAEMDVRGGGIDAELDLQRAPFRQIWHTSSCRIENPWHPRERWATWSAGKHLLQRFLFNSLPNLLDGHVLVDLVADLIEDFLAPAPAKIGRCFQGLLAP